jgi:hypothetical protein
MCKAAVAAALAMLVGCSLGCVADGAGLALCDEPEQATLAPDADDEVLDPADPPTDPDPIGAEEEAAAAVMDLADATDLDDDSVSRGGDPVDGADAEEVDVEPSAEAAMAELAGDDGSCISTSDWGVKKKKGKGKGKDKPKKDPADPPPQCPKRSEQLSPKGLTFVIHFSKHKGDVALKQLKAVKHLIRPRDIFFIEQKEEAVLKLRKAFPCNDIHFIAYPNEFQAALDASELIDGISIDWEGGNVFNHGPSWSAGQLEMWANKIRNHGKTPSFVPFWPGSFNDGAITRKSKMRFELAQIQNRCAKDGAVAFASTAKGMINTFQKAGLGARDVGFEISLNSFAHADNHTGVDASVACTRKAYGKGARAIYLYGNGQPHLDDYFKKIAKAGLRKAE